jgi:predicted acyl esterase
MSEDQRFAEMQPNVATFTTDILTDDITFGGELIAKLNISSTSTDADFTVKLIGACPNNEPENADKPNVVYTILR